MINSISQQVEQITRHQSKSVVWLQHQYGRITTSKIDESRRCKTCDDIMIAQLVDKRNLQVESCGLSLSTAYQIFGASPDKITNELFLEIKSPMKKRSICVLEECRKFLEELTHN